MRESKIEKSVCDYAASKGIISIKLNGNGDRGKPDRLFLPPDDNAFFIEFKALGKKPDVLQIHWIRKLRKQGFDVFVVDNVAYGKGLIDAH